MARVLKPYPASGSAVFKISRGGGLPVLLYWAEKTLAHRTLLWQKLNHKSACKSCAWGTGGQKGGFFNEKREPLQRCAKSVESIAADLQGPVGRDCFARMDLARLQELSSMEADKLGRLSHPVIRRANSNYYEPIGWEEVFAIAARAFSGPPERVASYSSGRSSNEAAYILQLMLRAYGSNNLADCSDLCHSPSTVGLKAVFGSGTSMVSLDDLRQSDCVVLLGSNAPANHPRLMNELIQVRERGGAVIVVNPVLEVGLINFATPASLKSLAFGSEIASLYLQPDPGSDVALLIGLAKSLIESNRLERAFLEAHTEDWQAVIAHIQATPWERIEHTCGIERAAIEGAAAVIGRAERTVFAWAMGITQHANGVDNVYAIANLALLTGNAGKPGAGTMPIRGHSNVQGFGSMGVSARPKEAIQKALETLLRKPLSRAPGYDTRALIQAAESGKIDALLCLGGNLWGANPDRAQTAHALGRIKTIIYLSTKPNPGHFHGLAAKDTIIIPVFTRDENPHKTTTESGNNFVRLNSEGQTHLHDADLISEVEFLTRLAHRMHGETPLDWRRLTDTAYVRGLIAQTIPGYEKIGEIDRTGEEFTIAGRIFHEPRFATPTGKAKMFVTPLPVLDKPRAEDFGVTTSKRAIALVLVTVRSYSQHNTVVYKAGDTYRGMPHRNCILMHPEDAAAAGFAEHERVTVTGKVGQKEQVEIIFGAPKRGAALMFYPEINDIIRPPVDLRCGIPAFKRNPVLIHAD
ncbi:FdhF/YdeP family oxidoreductase [Gloeobacter violaceus]|uniref:Gll1882 protein n=1 Tax=Gloeobacter violaceus (strain ATCC 29082 / PCC 7421) TaxID=251221 RepID=Q7NJF0_GLOVI|nr:FdhF/YdeP family oxidoreductase [Gloeobacter violaceus]BAC89823.1 gll1882 [Gloeobacter violaceus PCC 7421]